MIIFDPDHFPPTDPSHVRFSGGGTSIIESLNSEQEGERQRLYDFGETIGHVLYANVYGRDTSQTPDGDFLRRLGRGLTAHWENDEFDEAFHEGLNVGIQYEHWDTNPGKDLYYDPDQPNLI